ncbi:hypothetical protein AK812_SmicGene2774 [Symbiodinium microadriaticum]|uniref:Reverse transcriptase domain-containing protein n=1 Tax=Symbiodinium microadriaticum TaxID=2951 RepID=A0A1Q9F0M9_SYMMI|nr:hypothetical protein AK812_SmicGene2774 [Symbiodinium microadriaticum]
MALYTGYGSFVPPLEILANGLPRLAKALLTKIGMLTARKSPRRDQWWQKFVEDAITKTSGLPTLILGDLNLRLTNPWGRRIGDLCWEEGSEPPAAFADLMQHLNLWVPSTFSSVHSGLSHTWASPGHGTLSRIDFVLAPHDWQTGAAGSRVLYDIDFGQTGVDHFAVCCEFDFLLSHPSSPGCRKRTIDLQRLQLPESSAIIHRICESIPEVPWKVDAHTHYDCFARHLYESLVAEFPAQRKTCRRAFFSDATWGLRQQRVHLRKMTHHASLWLHNLELRVAVFAWRTARDLTRSSLLLLGETLACVFDLRKYVGTLRQLKTMLRKSVLKDRREYLHGVAMQAASSTVKSTVDKLRPLIGPPKRRQRGGQPLPAVKLEDGSIAISTQDAEERWVRHFSAVEDGAPCSPQDIVDQCLERQNAIDLEDHILTASELITRTQLEAGLRSSKRGRAAGKDKLPSDLLHSMPAGLSQALYTVFLKFAMRLQEPIQWKGGNLLAFWKQKGPALECSSHRAILVSSSIGKAVHAALRTQCSPALDAAVTPLQVGGRRGCPVELALHAARLWQETCKARRQCCALLFVDLKDAFHRVARPLVHGGSLDDSTVNNVIATLGLADDVAPRLRAYAKSRSLLSLAGAPESVARMVSETNQDTWFAYGTLELTARVEAGTRPGDNLADMIFSFLFAEILHKLRVRFDERGLSVVLPWQPEWMFAEPGTCEPRPDSQVSPVDITWMDDLALLVHGDTPASLVENVRSIARETLEECVRATLVPNLAAGKTEGVLVLVGKGAKKIGAELFRHSEPQLRLHSDLWPQAQLRLVSTYKHVGGIIQAGGGLAKELRARVGSAWAAFRKHKRQVFASPIVDIGDKAILFGSLIESTLYYGVGAWSIVDDKTLDKLDSTIVSMARLMLRPRFSMQAARHVSSLYAVATARLLPASVSVRLARLRHLRALVSNANPELWALLHAEQKWLQLVQADIEWAAITQQSAGREPAPFDRWASAIEVARTSARTWKRLIKQVKTAAQTIAQWEAEVQQYHGLLLRQMRRAGLRTHKTQSD